MQVELWEPHSKQFEFINSIGSGRKISQSHFVGGRGSGKTFAAAYKLVKSGFVYNPGLPHIWTFPTYQDCLDYGLQTFIEDVPKHLWSFNQQRMRITLANGAFINLRSRQVDRADKDPFRGPNYAGAISDEPVKDKTNRAWQLLLATVRHPNAQHMFCDTTSTPMMNWYYQLCHGAAANVFHCTTLDNPVTGAEYAEALIEDYSEEFARQEIYAEWISQSGRVWDNADLAQRWPNGNMHWHKYDPTLPYVLGFDLGVRSGWVIIQSVEPMNELGQRIPGHPPIDVIVGEYTPNNEGAQQTLARIEHEFGKPMCICVGADVGTRSVADAGITPAVVLRNRGWNMPMRVCKRPYADKQLQHMVLSGLWCNAKGQRRLCISEELYRGDPSNKRGVVELVEQDTWPEQERAGEYLPKDKKGGGIGLEDIRDALLYWAIMMHPPNGVARIQSH